MLYCEENFLLLVKKWEYSESEKVVDIHEMVVEAENITRDREERR